MRWLLLLALIVAACDGAEELRSYRVGLSPWVPWSPAQVALVRGLWRELGVTVTVSDHVTPEEHCIAVTHRQIDLAIDRVGSVIALQQSGLPMTLRGECGWAHHQERLIGRAASGPERGATIGVQNDDPAALGFLDAALRARGVGLTEVTVKVLAPQDLAGEYIRRRLDWLLVEEPFASDVLDRGAHLLASIADLPGCVPIAFAARADVIATMPRADLVRILSGWLEASRWMADPANAKACRAILVERTLLDAQDEPAVQATMNAVRNHDLATLTERNRPAGGLQQYVAHCAALLTQTKRLQRPIDPAAMIDCTALNEALAK